MNAPSTRYQMGLDESVVLTLDLTERPLRPGRVRWSSGEVVWVLPDALVERYRALSRELAALQQELANLADVGPWVSLEDPEPDYEEEERNRLDRLYRR